MYALTQSYQTSTSASIFAILNAVIVHVPKIIKISVKHHKDNDNGGDDFIIIILHIYTIIHIFIHNNSTYIH